VGCVAFDVETSRIPCFLPWHPEAFLVCLSTCDENWNRKTWFFNHEAATKTPKECTDEIREYLGGFDRVIAHNLKFDYSWLHHYGVDLEGTSLWCTLVVEYLIRGHENIQHLSLEELSRHYGVPPKKDKVKVYWDAGVETDQVPADVLQVYCEQDAVNAMTIYKHQTKQAMPFYKLISLEMESLKAFAEMEYNGMRVDLPLVSKTGEEIGEELDAITKELRDILGIENLDSPAQKAVALFGGVLKEDILENILDENGEPVLFKTGLRSGEIKQRRAVKETEVNGLFDPVELKIPTTDSGQYSTGKLALAMLKGKTPEQKRVIELLGKRSPLSKLKSGYFDSIPEIQIGGFIHGNLNQALTVTGRLSCSKPNLQNIPSRNNTVKLCIISRF